MLATHGFLMIKKKKKFFFFAALNAFNKEFLVVIFSMLNILDCERKVGHFEEATSSKAFGTCICKFITITQLFEHF